MDTSSTPRINVANTRIAPERTRPSALVWLSLAIAYGGGWWLHTTHAIQGAASGHGAPDGAAHWFRDSTLALPVIFVAVWVGLRLVRSLLRPFDGDDLGVLRPLAIVAVVGFVTSVAVALASPVHAVMFRAEHQHVHDGMAMPAHMMLEGVLALLSGLVITSVVVFALGGCMWSTHAPSLARRTRALPARRMAGVALTGALIASMALRSGLDPVEAQVIAPIGPCPAGAPVKAFTVSAIDITMMLDRFGDHDPQSQMYVLDNRIADVRAEEAAGREGPSIGLRDDAIQPLAIRANQGDCVVIDFTNRTTRPAPQATDNTYGIHIDGLAFEMDSSGDAIGNNASSAVAPGATTTYTYWIPDDPTIEGAHYMYPGPGNRQAVAHGLFGALIVEPPGSTYRNPTTGLPQESGWEADIIPAAGVSFRENVKIFHEIGNESETDFVPVDINGVPLPTIDPHTDAYRPGSRAINYRSEPFMARLDYAPDQKSTVYGSYTFSDTTNIIPRGYLGDPTKFRLLHAGSEVFHVYHLHGGADRWRLNPAADPTFDYAETGLDKHPSDIQAESSRIDSQSMGPGEAFNLEIENGAGGGQQGAGEFLFHCHIAHHYFAGHVGLLACLRHAPARPHAAARPARAPQGGRLVGADRYDRSVGRRSTPPTSTRGSGRSSRPRV